MISRLGSAIVVKAVAGVVTVGVLTALKVFTKVHERDISDALTGPGGKDSSNLTDILKAEKGVRPAVEAGMRTAAAIEAGVILGIGLNVEVKEDADLKEVVRLEADLEVEV